MDTDTPASDWRAGYKQALIEYVLSHGQPIQLESDGRPNYYGWTDYRLAEHFAPWEKEGCTAIATDVSEVRERSYNQFQGTFYEGSEEESFIILTKVRCACGAHTDIPWALQANTAELIVKLLREDS